ncbi:diguanylate cyclase [Fervidicella metallireducens AeB]|uniref:Diguanylate cyclase n=1 Tax=Fervidicella metallireducens AeB TaxID=1403537 RepID=A0A017RS47_9CLOT|nr:NifB/NifX family molybdenum-iron cluster-binding protein [Fervidicella metallireducens]EYE87294.1 diguanylate cyclase [Fervidicella metallireducens AeB]
MRIAISSEGKSISDLMDVRFGRCNYFLIYDLESGDMKCVENSGQSASGGAGIAAAQQIIDEKVDIVITGNLGPNAFNMFNAAGIKVMKSDALIVEKVIELYKNGELTELTQSGPAHGGMGNGAGFRGGR